MKHIWDVEELATHWSLSFEEMQLLKSKPSRSHLPFVAQLKYYRYSGRFPGSAGDIPPTVIHYLADQVGADVDQIRAYDWSGRTGTRHRREILDFLGVRRVSAGDKVQFSTWLVEHAYTTGSGISDAHEHAFEWFRHRKIECPMEGQLDRLARSAYQQFEAKLFKKLSAQLSPACCQRMDASLDSEDGDAEFSKIKADPGRAGLDSVLKETAKLAYINAIQLPEDALNSIHPKVLHRYRQRIQSESAWDAKQHPEPIRHALLAIFLYHRRREIIDGLVDLLIQIVHRMSVRADRKLVRELIGDYRKVHGKTTLLFRIAEAALDNPDGRVRDVIFPVAGVETLKSLQQEQKSSGPTYQRQVHRIIRASYGNHYRRMLPEILKALTFRSNNARHRPVLDALHWLQRNRDNGQRYIGLTPDIPVEGVIRPKWRDIVVEENEGKPRINRINYEICVLQALRDGLRCKEIWVDHADRYRNPDDDLPRDFNQNREDYYQDLGCTADAVEFADGLKQQMQQALADLNKRIPRNRKVRILRQGKNRISITPFDPLSEPPNLAHLKREVSTRWPMTGLLDVLKEADLRIGFTRHFQSVADRQILDTSELQKRLLLCLYGMGTNTGLKRISGSRHGISYKELLTENEMLQILDAIERAA